MVRTMTATASSMTTADTAELRDVRHDSFLGSSSSSWLETREDANAYCEDYAASSGIDGTNFKIVLHAG